MKKCRVCKKTLMKTNFHKDKTRKDGYANLCKICKELIRNCIQEEEYRNQPKIKHKKQYYDKGYDKVRNADPIFKEKKKIYSKEYKLQNIKNIREYERERYKTCLDFKIKKCLRSRIRSAIKGGRKLGSAVRDLGCSVEGFKGYMRLKFYPHPKTGERMTWHNWGKGYNRWQIDHIVELQHVDLQNKEDFVRVSHFTNLQPLWYCDHLIKGKEK